MVRYEVEYNYLVAGDDTAVVDAINEDEAIEKAQIEAQKKYGLLEDFYGYEVNELDA